jgi:hypothetical protein
VHPPRRIQPAALVRANGKRQAIAALQDGWRRWPHTLRHIQSSTNSAKSFSGRVRMSEIGNFRLQETIFDADTDSDTDAEFWFSGLNGKRTH